MIVGAEALRATARRIFEAAGSTPDEADKVAMRLVEANLTGHDSHGVIRIHRYIGAVRGGWLHPNTSAEVVAETGAVIALDGHFGYGQVVAEQAMARAIEVARTNGVALMTLRNSSHVGRLADWVLMAAAEGMAAIMFCNGSGALPFVVPHGAREARSSTNPLAVAVPVLGDEPFVLDFATAAIAEGKVLVAHHTGVEVPEDCLLTPEGEATRDPSVLYREPRGALLPFGGRVGGHKGGGLTLVCDLLAGALSGGRCNHPVDKDQIRFANNLFTIVAAPEVYGDAAGIGGEIRRFLTEVKEAAPRTPDGEVLIPGEPERRTKAIRSRDGIPLPDATFREILEAGEMAGVERAELERLAAGAAG
ncbi:MAG: malate/lactate/ureidoglycolate dehydrogenase [Geminicoccaceae bacterium]|nr:malate/lactate/ureidoglycolate dehydrogenase [Geminicoccaceae bacterium]